MTSRLQQCRALAWELWARNRYGLPLTLLGVPIILILAQQAVASNPQLGRFMGILNLLALWTAAYLVMVFSYADFSPRTLQTGYPRHALKLPVPTWLLVAVPMGLAVLVLFAYGMTLLQLILTKPLTTPDFGFVLLTVIIGMSWMQGVNWGLNRTPFRAALVLLVLAAITVVCLLSVVSVAAAPLIGYDLAVVTLVVLAFTGISFALWSVSQIRKGRTVGRGIIWSEMVVPGFAMRTRLKSAQKAQFWLEWRVFGSALPLAALVLGIALFCTQFLPRRASGMPGPTAMIAGMFLYMAALVGFELAKSHFGAKDHRMSAFWATRPLSTVSLAFAKLKVAAWSVLLGATVCLAPLVPGWLLAGDSERAVVIWTTLSALHGPFGAATIIALSMGAIPVLGWILCGNVLAVSFFGSKYTKLKILLALVAGAVLVGYLVYRLLSLPDWQLVFVQYYPKVFGVTAAVSAGGLGLLLRQFSRYADWQILRSRMAGTIAVCTLAMVAVTQLEGLTRQPYGMIGLTATLGMLSLYPWILGPIALRSNRHR